MVVTGGRPVDEVVGAVEGEPVAVVVVVVVVVVEVVEVLDAGVVVADGDPASFCSLPQAVSTTAVASATIMRATGRAHGSADEVLGALFGVVRSRRDTTVHLRVHPARDLFDVVSQ